MLAPNSWQSISDRLLFNLQYARRRSEKFASVRLLLSLEIVCIGLESLTRQWLLSREWYSVSYQPWVYPAVRFNVDIRYFKTSWSTKSQLNPLDYSSFLFVSDLYRYCSSCGYDWIIWIIGLFHSCSAVITGFLHLQVVRTSVLEDDPGSNPGSPPPTRSLSSDIDQSKSDSSLRLTVWRSRFSSRSLYCSWTKIHINLLWLYSFQKKKDSTGTPRFLVWMNPMMKMSRQRIPLSSNCLIFISGFDTNISSFSQR